MALRLLLTPSTGLSCRLLYATQCSTHDAPRSQKQSPNEGRCICPQVMQSYICRKSEQIQMSAIQCCPCKSECFRIHVQASPAQAGTADSQQAASPSLCADVPEGYQAVRWRSAPSHISEWPA